MTSTLCTPDGSNRYQMLYHNDARYYSGFGRRFFGHSSGLSAGLLIGAIPAPPALGDAQLMAWVPGPVRHPCPFPWPPDSREDCLYVRDLMALDV